MNNRVNTKAIFQPRRLRRARLCSAIALIIATSAMSVNATGTVETHSVPLHRSNWTIRLILR